MALAILELLDTDGGELVFRLDRGTNTGHRLEIGSQVGALDGEPRVQQVYHTVPQAAARGEAGGLPWEAGIELRVAAGVLQRGPAFAQLVTWKDRGRATAVSDVVDLAGVAAMDSAAHTTYRPAMKARVRSMQATAVHADGGPECKPARAVPHHFPQMSGAASLDGLIGEIVKLAAPLVTQLLQGAAGAGGGTLGGTGAGKSDGSGMPPPGLRGGAALTGLMQVLQTLLGGIADTPAIGPQLVTPKSLGRVVRSESGNRFISGGPRHVAEPFIFGIDDALIASLVGPMLQILPQLMNAANSKRIELKKADNALMAGIVSDVQKQLMMNKLLEAQRAAQAQGPAAPIDPAQLEALIGMLGSMPAQPPGQPTPATPIPPAVVTGKSLSLDTAASRDATCTPSDRAVLSFEFGSNTAWSGTELPVFQRGGRVVLRPRLVVAKGAPSSALPRAILKLQLRDSLHPEVRVEKIFKLRDLHADTPLDCSFDAAELAPLPEQSRLNVLAQLRWPHARGGSSCATGAAEIVLVGPSFLRAGGGQLDGEREPTDMSRYRSFWNKVWQTPAARSGAGTRLWELDVQARCTALVDKRHDSNALMETRLLASATADGGLSARTQGRMKTGIELSLAELNRLLPLWNERQPLDSATLAALGAQPMLAEAGREAYCRLRLKGRAGQAGMVWTVPVFKLQAYTLSRVSDVDERGQVRATAETEIAFPMPVAIRALGLKSTT